MLDKLLSLRSTSSQPLGFIDRIRGMLDTEIQVASRPAGPVRPALLFSLDGIDAGKPSVSREEIGQLIPHRGEMLLLDHIAWIDENLSGAVAVKRLRHDEFWVHGHFPDNPIMPGALLVEAGSQLALYLANRESAEPAMGLLLRIENARFRTAAVPGDELLILCRKVDQARSNFVYDVQGVVRNRIVFDGRIAGKLSKPGRFPSVKRENQDLAETNAIPAARV